MEDIKEDRNYFKGINNYREGNALMLYENSKGNNSFLYFGASFLPYLRESALLGY